MFDWCYDQMTANERSTLITRWNGYIETLNAKDWGGIGMEANNYYTGYMRNTIEWGIATYPRTTAPAILQYGLATRWTISVGDSLQRRPGRRAPRGHRSTGADS